MKRTLFIAALALVLVPVWAQDASSEFDTQAAPEVTVPADLGSFHWSGDQEFSWRQAADVAATRTGAQLDGKMTGTYQWHDVKVVGAASVKDNEFVPGETAIFWAPGVFKFGLGLQEFSWGVADKKNPTDTLNARDYRKDLDASRLVNPAATVAWYPAEWVSVEAVYEPWKLESKFPTDFQKSTQAGLSAQAAVLKATSLGALFGSYNPVVTAEGSSVYSFDKPVVGGRANFFLHGLDLSVSYVYDRDPFYTPVVTMKSVAVPANALGAGSPATSLYVPGQINLVSKRIHRWGLDAKTTIDIYGLWLEAAYNKTEAASFDSYDNRHDSVEWTTGIDFNYGPASAYYVNVQYAGTWVVNYDASTVKDYTTGVGLTQLLDSETMKKMTYRSMVQSMGDQTEVLMNSATVSLKWPLAEATVTPSLSGAVIVPFGYDDTRVTRLASAYFKPEIDWVVVDGIHVLFGADLAYGWVKNSGSSDVSLDTTSDRLGLYTPENNVYVKVQYKWNGSLGGN